MAAGDRRQPGCSSSESSRQTGAKPALRARARLGGTFRRALSAAGDSERHGGKRGKGAAGRSASLHAVYLGLHRTTKRRYRFYKQNKTNRRNKRGTRGRKLHRREGAGEAGGMKGNKVERCERGRVRANRDGRHNLREGINPAFHILGLPGGKDKR